MSNPKDDAWEYDVAEEIYNEGYDDGRLGHDHDGDFISQAKQAIKDHLSQHYLSVDEVFNVITETHKKLFMYEQIMGKISVEGVDVAEEFVEYQKLEPKRQQFANWLEQRQRKGKVE